MSELVLCSNCGAPAKYRGKKLCARCYQRFKAHGDFETHERQRQTCVAPFCREPVKAYGYCSKHWRRVEKHGDEEDRKWSRRGSDRCAVPGCGAQHRSMGLCRQHYQMEQRKGHPIWRTLGKQKVHQDRPWTPDTVRDPSRVTGAFTTLTAERSSSQSNEPGDDAMTVETTTTRTVQWCRECEQDVDPELCGELQNGEACTDLVCPLCGEELADQLQSSPSA